MLEIAMDDTFTLAENIFLQKIAEIDKYWAFNIETGEHYSLNETSYWILEHIAQSRPVEPILRSFLSMFDVDEKEAKDDFVNIINHFLDERIVKRRGKDEEG